MNSREPNFIVIGAGKSGTTSLYEYLSEHPDVFMSPVKETNFFALEGEEIGKSKDDPDQLYHYPWSVTDEESYKKLFEEAKKEKALGEVSPMYLYSKKAAQNIKKKLPNAKLIVILRDPVDRLYSRYMHLVRENREPSSKFEDALSRNSIWWKRNDLVQEGFYYSHLSTYYDLFDESQIRVYLYEDYRNNPKEVLSSIYQFIGVDSSFVPDFSAEYNVSGTIKNKTVDQLIGQQSILKNFLNSTFPSTAEWMKNQKNIKKWVNKLRKKNLEKAPLSHATRVELIQSVYQTEILKLQQLLGRDLSEWCN